MTWLTASKQNEFAAIFELRFEASRECVLILGFVQEFRSDFEELLKNFRRWKFKTSELVSYSSWKSIIEREKHNTIFFRKQNKFIVAESQEQDHMRKLHTKTLENIKQSSRNHRRTAIQRLSVIFLASKACLMALLLLLADIHFLPPSKGILRVSQKENKR